MKTLSKYSSKWRMISISCVTQVMKLVGSLKRSKELENNYFTLQRVGNALKVEAKGIGGSFGEIYIDKACLRKTFQVLRNQACEEHDFCGLSASTLRSVRIGQSMTAILRRNGPQLRFEMIQGGKGSIGFGRKESEEEHRKGLLELEVSALRLFSAEELSAPHIDCSAQTTWAMERPYGYVHK